jgi:guanyl-specific ribonuclease Sa
MTVASRDLNNSLVIVFHKDFAELLLPALCERLEQARALAMAGRTAEAGRKYQALLVSSQILAYAVAIQTMAQYGDRRLQAGGQISETQEKFAGEAEPIFRAALSEDPREIERALNAHPEVFASWATLLEQWPSRVDDGAHKAKVAMVVLDIAFLVVATYEAAGAAAEIAASGRPPMPPLPAFATAEGVAALSPYGPAVLELAETLRKLIALGALDAGVVAALSRSLGSGAAPSTPILPNATQMSAGSTGGDSSRDPTGSAQPSQAKAAVDARRATAGFINDVTVASRGKGVGHGTVDLRATLEGIQSGKLSPRDIFRNDQGLLPRRGPGYYQEFVHPTPGVSGAGPQRIIRGQGGELYYTPDHYKTFIPLN